jgi:hypothetical protein
MTDLEKLKADYAAAVRARDAALAAYYAARAALADYDAARAAYDAAYAAAHLKNKE